jgi:cell pole-organizing protein PopZ
MAQSSSVQQREPSMEEILASIRRIIEDSDSGRKGFEAGPIATAELPVARAEMESFRGELGPVSAAAERPAQAATASAMSVTPPRAEPTPVAELAKPFRLAELQAQVARETTAPARAPDAERKPVSLADVQAQLARDAARASTASSAPSRQVVDSRSQPAPVRPAAERPSLEFRAEKANQPPVQAAPRGEVVAKPFAQQSTPPTEPMPTAQAAATANPAPPVFEATARQIISPVAGRQVAAAFGELSEAFAARGKRTFDEMAEQMLRPMLQEWLDNNLPLLVERLVREEIERVARGA